MRLEQRGASWQNEKEEPCRFIKMYLLLFSRVKKVNKKSQAVHFFLEAYIPFR
tara:strand:- start:177 stop:335 length:159 start_codon:yes stop_codon:yes gene_type:complete